MTFHPKPCPQAAQPRRLFRGPAAIAARTPRFTNSRRESVVGLMALDCGTCSVAFRVHYSEPGLVGPRTLPRLCAIGESDKTKLRNVRLPAPDTRRARPPPRHADRHPGGEPATPRCQ